MRVRWRFITTLLVTILLSVVWSANAAARGGPPPWVPPPFQGDDVGDVTATGGKVVNSGNSRNRNTNVNIPVFAPEVEISNDVTNRLRQGQGQSQFGAVLGFQKAVGTGNKTDVVVIDRSVYEAMKMAPNANINPSNPTAECLATWATNGGVTGAFGKLVGLSAGASGWKYSVICVWGEVRRAAVDNGDKTVAKRALRNMELTANEIARKNGFNYAKIEKRNKRRQAAMANTPKARVTDTAGAHSNITSLYE